MRGLCVGVYMVILCLVLPWQNGQISAYAQPAHWIFSTVIDIVMIFYHTKNQVGGLCIGAYTIGGVSIQPDNLPLTFFTQQILRTKKRCTLHL